MTFSEKSAWLMSAALLVGGGAYVNALLDAVRSSGELPAPGIPGLISFTVIVVLIALIGHIVIAALRPDEADAPKDEREKRVLQVAGNISGYVLGAAVVSGMFHYLLLGDGNVLFYIVFAGLVLSQLAEYAVQIVLLRRGY